MQLSNPAEANNQIVVLADYCNEILSVAHDGVSGCLGINKSYNHILHYFF